MEKRKDYEIAAEKFDILTSQLGLDVQSVFVPFSQSRNAGEASPSLNWRCTVTRGGKPVKGLESVDYMQGIGYAPSQKQSPRFPSGRVDKWAKAMQGKVEAETGFVARAMGAGDNQATVNRSRPIDPPTADSVLESLCRDSDVLDYSEYADWAADLGYDPDSRKGEAIYRQCLAYALALRAAIGDAPLAKLRAFASEM